MSLPVVVRPAARRDIREAQRWFETCRQGLGSEFVAEVLVVLERMGEMPELYGVVWQEIRAAGVRRFGYVVYYRVLVKRVEVLAVMHGGRDAGEWQGRG